MRARALVIFSVCFLVVPFVLGAAVLQDVIVRGEEGQTVVVLNFDEEGVSFSEFTLEGKLVIDCVGALPGFSGEEFTVERGGIKEIAITRFEKADLLRITISHQEDVPYTIVGEGTTVVITFAYAEETDFPEWRIGGAPVEPTTAPEEEEVAEVEEVKVEEVKVEEEPAVVIEEVPEVEEEKPVVEEAPQPPPKPKPKPKPKVRPVRKKVDEGRRVTIDAEGADLETVLRALGRYVGKNIVIGKGVSGEVSVHLQNVPWRKALEVILKSQGYTFIEEEEVIRVGKGEDFAKEREAVTLSRPLVQRVYPLEFAKASEIVKVIGSNLSERGHVEVDDRTNSLIVTDIDDVQVKVERLIEVLDSRTPQVEIEAKIVDVDKEAIQQLGINWSASTVEGRTYSMSGSVEVSDASAIVPGGAVIRVGMLRSFAQIEAALSALETEHRLRTIANPRVTAMNNMPAKVLGGVKFMVTTTDIRGNPVTNTYEVGAKLEVTPYVNSESQVTMDIKAELSDVIGAGTSTPYITTTEAQTRVLVNDGETLVLGGFVRTKESRSVVGIPVLKDIPLIGGIFRRTETQRQNREVLIFITPHIVKR